jgi:2-dehydro-3-deoxy-D-arabinonate dehydratase
MKLFKTTEGIFLEHADKFYILHEDWDDLINHDELYSWLLTKTKQAIEMDEDSLLKQKEVLAPIGRQEVWAAGVTYMRSREARMEESRDSGGADFYDKVYEADRPELFFKSLPHRVAGPGQEVYIRRDSSWSVPEPELALFINAHGRIQGYSVANDMSSRSIEGENPLYLPQAKMYERSAALGPCLYVPENKINPEALITMSIFRKDEMVYKDSVSISRMKRTHTELSAFLFREMDFAWGVFLMTGTCLVPPNDFTLQEEDKIDISIQGIGHLINRVVFNPGSRSGD